MFHYFGYGSNLDLTSLRAKGVEPRLSRRATLHGWSLAFDVRHWFRHEGGVANIHPTGRDADRVEGVVHTCDDGALTKLDALESFGSGYDRVDLEVSTVDGPVRATAYVGLPAALGRDLLPSRRYLNIVLRGAVAAGLDASYIQRLRDHPVHPARDYPPFEHPPGPVPTLTREALAQHPKWTALDCAVFDMGGARPELQSLVPLFGGRDMTLFHVKRLDTSDGSETEDDVRAGRVSDAARRYLNAYLHEYSAEFRYVGRYAGD